MTGIWGTTERVGRYRVYTDGAISWYYVGTPGSPEWYAYRDECGDGAYVISNPGRVPALRRALAREIRL